ncbi:hypothetical protein JO84_gp311 [Aureococcus anophagefferens virus]|uniref:Uncharacterized protein n=1 Tax=Aureococcus anophagefferens virus TaxID=1474867 RepID=A0A076FFH5_9VIRU|nr:hypothetical protein JO84_gp311 [Aureococcus anophagefferens virus]AII16999.1 hypothetical protein AaV_163 [Aureococcus anophagefferens virus]UOG94079.1 hypothetical protein MKD35_38 [Aureococcus anophagefferens virus]
MDKLRLNASDYYGKKENRDIIFVNGYAGSNVTAYHPHNQFYVENKTKLDQSRNRDQLIDSAETKIAEENRKLKNYLVQPGSLRKEFEKIPNF